MKDSDEIMDIKSAAKFIGMRKAAFYNGYLGTREIPYMKLGGRYFYRKSDIEKWLERNTHQHEDVKQRA